MLFGLNFLYKFRCPWCLLNKSNLNVKTSNRLASVIALGATLTLGTDAWGNSSFWETIEDPTTREQLKSFVAAKEAQANASTNNMPASFKTFFVAAEKGDWLTVSNLFEYVGQHNGQFLSSKPPDLPRGTAWDALQEIWGIYAAFAEGDEKYSVLFDNDIIESIPRGSIYFGGTDPGRFIVTAMQTSQIKGEPFFTLTQNAQADGSYLDYLRSMYGKKIYLPSADDFTACYQEYGEDGAKRLQNHQLEPGENISVGKDGRIEVSGAVAVMKINGLITKVVFDKNINHEFYVEESFPSDWMYPYLEPHGLIFKLNREPLPELSEQTIQRNNDYWTKTVSPMIGNWVDDETSVKDIATFAEKVFLHHDFSSFAGDPRFVQNSYAHCMFSKERDNIAKLYAWHAKHSHNETERERMNRQADFAFRQSWALCPNSPDAVFEYVQFLMDENGSSDALLVAETAAKFPSEPDIDAAQFENLVVQMKRYLKVK